MILTTVGVTTFTTATASAVGTIAIQTAITVAAIGAQLALAARAPKPKIGDTSLTTEQTVGPRPISFGYVRSGGTKIFEDRAQKFVHRVVAVNHGWAEFERYYLGEVRVTPALDGYLEQIRYWTSGEPRILMLTRPGDPDQLAIDTLVNAFPGSLDSRFRARGLALLYARFRKIGDPQDAQRVYPNGFPDISAAFYAGRVYDPRDEAQDPDDASTWVYSDNPALVWLHARRDPDLCWRSNDFSFAPISYFDVPSVIAAANVCDELVDIKGGGTEKRYTISVTFHTEQRPADIEKTILSVMEGWAWITPDGRYAIRAGIWAEPTVTIGASAITGSQLVCSPGDDAAVNVVKAVIRWPDNQWQDTEAPAARDEDDIDARGAEYETILDLATTSWRQAQRLSKRTLRRALAKWRGTIETNLLGELVAEQRFFTLDHPDIGEAIQVETVRFWRISSDRPGCRIEFVQTAEADWSWDAETEEGAPPEVTNEGLDVDQDLDAPTGLSVDSYPSSPAPVSATLSFGNPSGPANRKIIIEHRVATVGDPEQWERTSFVDHFSPKTVGPLLPGTDYEFRARYETEPYVVSDWSDLADGTTP